MLEVDHLTFTYPKMTGPVIEGLSFHIEGGEIFGFLGPSGAGKSTTQKILIGLLKQYGGTVAVFGVDLSAWQADYYERIGVSFEFPTHFLKLTALENLAYFSRLYSGKTEPPQSLLEWVGLANDGQMPVSHYSKGMKNRLSVARALLHQPQLLFLDEPTAGLDPVNARRIKDLIKAQQHAGRTVFLTTHDMTVADALCDRVAFIIDGQIKLIDAPAELKLRYGQAMVRVEYQGDTGAHSREFPLAGLGENVEFLSLLRTQQVRTTHTLEATLEDVFIQVTGQALI
jgi:fluoroquinolone transport system ATP-binding protein